MGRIPKAVGMTRKKDRHIQAREDYDFGYETPIFKRMLIGAGAFSSSLDSAELPTELVKILVSVSEELHDVVEVTIQAPGHVYILRTAAQTDWMLRVCRHDLNLYDCVSSVPQKRPTIKDVANWHDIHPSDLRTVAGEQRWSEMRALRYREMEMEAMTAARLVALEDAKVSVAKRLARIQKMEEKYDEALNVGEAIITTRDVISAMGLGHRMQKDMATMGADANPMQAFVQLLVASGIAEPISKAAALEIAEPEVIEAEFTAVEKTLPATVETKKKEGGEKNGKD